jgi:hypothetical protein
MMMIEKVETTAEMVLNVRVHIPENVPEHIKQSKIEIIYDILAKSKNISESD